jgi:alpha-tubulin suppressor-like RCC1 family protein
MVGQTNNYLLIANALPDAGGSYELIASNRFGVATNQVVACTLSPNAAAHLAIGAWGSDIVGQCDIPSGIVNPIAMAAGAFHNLALQGDGTVVAWGKNWNGQTNVPAAATNVIAIAAGSYHSLALRNNGSVISWGGPIGVPHAATNIVAIAAGWAHCLALRDDGQVVAWGNNDYGQTNLPPNLTDVIAIAAGYYHNLALRSDHSIVSWGSQTTVPAAITNAVAIAAGWEHSLALSDNGQVIAWGDNSYGQSSVPEQVISATAIKAGYGYGMAQLNDGTLVVWGRNGLGVTNVPAGLADVAGIACGEDHALAMTGYGLPQILWETQTAASHVGGRGLLKANVAGTYPMSCQWYHAASPLVGATNDWLLLTNVQPSDAGSYTLVANNVVGHASLSADYTIDPTPYFLSPVPYLKYVLKGDPWDVNINTLGAQPLASQMQFNGQNLLDNGRINGAATPNLHLNPAAFEDSGLLALVVTNNFGSYTGLVASLVVTPIIGWGDDSYDQLHAPSFAATDVISVAAGDDHSLAVLANGQVAAWGNNDFNQNSVPPWANQVVAIADSGTHCLALKSDGSVVAWGNNSLGQIAVPATVQNAVAIAAGVGFSQALLPDGSIIHWGAYQPISVTNAIQLSTRDAHSVVLCADGSIYGWFAYGISETMPPRESYSNVVAVCAGVNAGLALQADGRVFAWGKNYYGQTNIPASASNIVAIAAGDFHFLALRADGVVVAWGDRTYSQCQVPPLAQSMGAIAAGSTHSLAVLGQPFQRTARTGESVVFSAGSYANRLAAYQWQFNGANIEGATNSTLSLENLTGSNVGTYRVLVSYPLGTIVSPAMTLSGPLGPLLFDTAKLSYQTPNGAVQMRLTGSSGVYPVVLYATTNLLDWTPVFTNSPTTNAIDFTDAPPSFSPQRFYRAVEQPN